MNFTGSSRVLVCLVAAILAMGCGRSAQQAGGGSSYDRARISAEELTAAGVDSGMNALQIIQRFRPSWLYGRGATTVRGSEPPIPVYVNGQRVSDGGGVALQRYAVREIRELIFLDSMTATQRFGTGHPSGAVMIYLK